jgi:hypothetical protein
MHHTNAFLGITHFRVSAGQEIFYLIFLFLAIRIMIIVDLLSFYMAFQSLFINAFIEVCIS